MLPPSSADARFPQFLAYYAQWRPLYEAVKAKFEELVATAEKLVAGEAKAPSPFLQECVAAVKDGSAPSARNYFATCSVQPLLQALGPVAVATAGGLEAMPGAEEPDGTEEKGKKQAGPAAAASAEGPTEEAPDELVERRAPKTRGKKKKGGDGKEGQVQNAFAALSLEEDG